MDAWGKVLDKLLSQRVQYRLFSTNNLQANQYGFTPGRSTTDAIQHVIEIIRDFKAEVKHICMISLTIASAFNNVWWIAVLEELGKTKCPANLYNLVKSFLHDRVIQYDRNWVNREHTYRGCPPRIKLGACDMEYRMQRSTTETIRKYSHMPTIF